jgi:outer membrane protein assembly complex protein YaeT
MPRRIPPAAANRQPAARIRRLVRLAGIVVAALLTVVLLAGMLLHTAPVRRYVLGQVTSLLADRQIGLTAESLRYNLLALSVELRNVTVGSERASHLPAFARAGRIFVDLDPLALLRGRYVVQTGAVDDLDVHYVVDSTGQDNLPRPPDTGPTEDSQPLEYLIERFTISNARVTYEDGLRQMAVALRVPSIVLDGDALTNRHAIRLTAGDGTFDLDGRRTAIHDLTATLDVGTDDLRIADLTLVSEFAQLALSGSVTEFGAPALDLALQVEMTIAPAAAFAGQTEPVSGRLRGDATIRGPLDGLLVTSRIDGDGLSFRTIDGVTLSTTAEYDGGAQRVVFEDLQLDGPLGRASARGTVALDAQAGETEVNASVEDLDLVRLMRAAGLEYLVASRASGRMSASMPGLDHDQLRGTVRLTLTPSGRVAKNVVPITGAIAVDATVPAITVQLTDVRALGAAAHGRIVLANRERLSGTVVLRAADVGRVVAGAEALLGEEPGSLVGVPISGEATVEARLGGTVGAPISDLTLNMPALTVAQASGLRVDAQASYSPRAVDVRALDISWQQARAHVNGRIGLQDARPLALELAIEQVFVQELLRALDHGDVPVSGVVGGSGTVGGTLDSPRGEISLLASGITAYGELLGDLTADVVLDEQSLIHADVRLDKPQPDEIGVLVAGGTYDLGSGQFDVEISSERLHLLHLTLPDDVGVRAALDLNGRARGTATDPVASFRVSLDDLHVQEELVGPVTVDVNVAEQRAHVQARADRFTVNADATIELVDSYRSTITVTAEELDFATLPLPPDTPLTGQLRARVEAAADLTAIETATAVATFEHLTASWNDQPIVLDGPAVVRYAGERVEIERLIVTARDSTVSVAGDLPLDHEAEPGAIDIDARLDLATLAAYAPAAWELTADGTATLAGRITGTLQAIDPMLTLAVEQAAVKAAGFEPGLTDFRLHLEVSNGEVRMTELAALLGSARLEATAVVPLGVLPENLPVRLPRANGDAHIQAGIAELDLATLPGSPEGLAGSISVLADLRAPRPDLQALAGEVVFPVLQVQYNDLTFTQEGTSHVAIADGTARIMRMALEGSAGHLRADGSVELAGNQALDIMAGGQLELAVLSAFLDDVQADGPVTLELIASGTLGEPLLDGFIEINDATIVNRDPTVALEDLHARIDVSRQRAVLSRLSGTLNSGELSGSGAVEFGEGTLLDIDLRTTVVGMALDTPLNLRSLLDADIRVGRQGDLFLVAGAVTIQEAGLTQDLRLDTGLLGTIGAPRGLDLTTERNELLERIRLDVRVTTATPILLDNNLANGEVTADLRVLGTPYETGMSGRLIIEEESVITLNQRQYEVERGIITFVEERRIAPVFDLRLVTRAGSHDVVLAVTGPPDDAETVLTSDPALPEPDILALLVTGRTLDEMRGEEYEIVRGQVLSYVSGRAGASLGRGLERATGLSRVRLEPNLVGGETDPGARLTIGQDLTNRLRLIYSTDLVKSGDEIWIAEYDVTRRFQARTVRQENASYRFDMRHDVRFGGRPEPRRAAPRVRPTVGEVTLAGEPGFEPRRVLDRFRVRTGSTYSFFDVRRGVERVEELYRDAGRLQARIRLRRQHEGEVVHLTLEVHAGPHVEITYTGVLPPRRVQREIALVWHRGVFDSQRTADVQRALFEWLVSRNYFAAQIDYRIEDRSPDHRVVMVTIDAGPQFVGLDVAFEGAAGIPPSELDAIVREQRLESALFTAPSSVTDLLRRYYREQGYLAATIAPPRLELDGARARMVLAVEEGPQFTIRRVAIQDNLAIASGTMLQEIPSVTGDPYLPAVAERSVTRIRGLYGAIGYNDAKASLSLAVDQEAGVLDLTFVVDEGRREIVVDVAVEGNEQTGAQLVSRQLAFQPGEPLAVAQLGQSRRRLYDTRAFALVDIVRDEVPPPASAINDDTPALPVADKPVHVTVSVREVQPFQIRYGAFYDTERGPGGIVDLSNHNSLGRARSVGLRTRYDSQLREGRLYFSQPSLADVPLETTANVFYTYERHPATALRVEFNVRRTGFSLAQEARLRNSYVLNYGFRFERQRTYDPSPARLFDDTNLVSPLTSTLTRETRDDVLDATRGQFMSHSFSVSPAFLGSDRPYIRYFGQFFTYRALQPERRARFTNEIIRPRFVYAAGVRLGLARGFGEGTVPFNERFLGGGSTTLRGFAQNEVGPIGPDGVPLGGEALVVVNNEIRFPLFSRFDGVAFIDVGNVFERVADMSFGLRSSGGVGLRVRTPWFLGRLDWGIPFDRRTGESRSVLFFSIGQAF